MAKRPEVRCSLEGGGPAAPSKFVLISAVAGGGTIPLLNGVNIIEVDSSVEVVGVGLNPSEEDVKPQVRFVFELTAMLRRCLCCLPFNTCSSACSCPVLRTPTV